MGNSQFQIPNGNPTVNVNLGNLKTCLSNANDNHVQQNCFSQNVTDTNNTPVFLQNVQNFENVNGEKVQSTTDKKEYNFFEQNYRFLYILAIIIVLFLVFQKK